MLVEPAPKRRIDFLDFVRGIAALSVAVGHTLEKYFSAAQDFLLNTFSLGAFGVIAFFILSGFVIPFTIEKYNDLRLFWTNRLFRLYPLYWASIVVVVLIVLSSLHPRIPAFEAGLPLSFVANLTMLQGFIKQPHAMDLYWTLGFELVFYAIMSVLFLTKLNKKSAWIFGFGIAVIAALGIAGALMKGTCAFPYRVFWMTCFFFGTATYRYWAGEMTRKAYVWLTSAFFATIGVATFISFFHFKMEITPENGLNATATLSSWAAAFTFFLFMTFGQKFRIPVFFQWLGRISYSVYIVHGILLILPLTFHPFINSFLILSGTLMVSWASYTWIEAPCQEIGKGVIAKMKARRLLVNNP